MLLLLFMEVFAEVIVGIVVGAGHSHGTCHEFIATTIDAFAWGCEGGGAGTVINESQLV